MLLAVGGIVSPTDTMRDGGLEPFAPFPRTLFGILPIVLVTRTESCTSSVLTGTIKYDRLSEEGRGSLFAFPKGPQSGRSQVIPARTSGGREQAIGGP